jgi:co-chaperonin GroES (HSP10)
MPPMLMKHDVDPAQAILDKVGMKKLGELKHPNGKEFRLMGNLVLIGVYERPKQTKSGLYLADQTIREDEHQGKAGLVLMKGRSAFRSDQNYDFGDDNVELGDWVAIFVSDGRKIVINGQLCRVVEDHHIRLKIPAPDVVF